MKKSEFEYLNKLLAILDASKVDMIVNLSSTWGEEDYDVTKNIKALKIKPYLDSNRNLKSQHRPTASAVFYTNRYTETNN